MQQFSKCTTSKTQHFFIFDSQNATKKNHHRETCCSVPTIDVRHFWFKYRLFTDKLSEIILDFQVWKTGFSWLHVCGRTKLLIISLASQPQKSNLEGQIFFYVHFFISISFRKLYFILFRSKSKKRNNILFSTTDNQSPSAELLYYLNHKR
jgi:hypothetical protein